MSLRIATEAELDPLDVETMRQELRSAARQAAQVHIGLAWTMARDDVARAGGATRVMREWMQVYAQTVLEDLGALAKSDG